jgi:hypothetical protein
MTCFGLWAVTPDFYGFFSGLGIPAPIRPTLAVSWLMRKTKTERATAR